MTLEERIKEIEKMANNNLPFISGLTRRDREEKEELMLEDVRKGELIEIIQELQTKNKELEEINQKLFEAAEAVEKQNEELLAISQELQKECKRIIGINKELKAKLKELNND